MLRFYAPIAALCGVAALVACSGRDPVADNLNNGAAAPEVDVLPPDESVATPTNELENGDDEDLNVSDSDGETDAIPAAFHGRWGLTPAACMADHSDTKGLLVVSSESLRFYEAQAKPAGELSLTPKSVSGSFAFTGEGEKWKKHEVLELQNHKLVRTESAPVASYTYARCTS